jgi:dipeptidase E
MQIPALNKDYSDKSMLFLSGGGSENITEEVDRFFLENILPNKDKIKILYIPVAKSGDMNVYKKSLKWLKDKFYKINKNNKLDFTLCTKLENIESLSDYDALYLGGGNTYRLLHLIYKSGFDKLLIEYIKSGGVVYGASAGAVLFGQDISTYIEDKYLPENIKHRYIKEKGLSVFDNYSFLTHFEDGDEVKVLEFFRKNKDGNVICIPPGVVVIINNNSFKVVGSKSVRLYTTKGFVDIFN